jgi:hypothetical protein
MVFLSFALLEGNDAVVLPVFLDEVELHEFEGLGDWDYFVAIAECASC